VESDFKKALHKYKEGQKKALEQMVAKKKTPTQMATKLNVSRQRIHQMLAEFGLKDTSV
jgi:Zn-dependent peptidase ImmA (M78 family)